MTGATLRIVLAIVADALAVFGGVLMFLQTGAVVWIIGGVVLSVPVVLFVLIPALRELQAERKARDDGR